MKSSNLSSTLLKICYGGVCFALCMVLPFLTAGNSELGGMLSPMHLPVLICGTVSGPIVGGAVGFFAPIVRCFTIGSPSPFLPRAMAMAVELLGYGVMMGLARPLIKKRFHLVYPSLAVSLAVGKLMGGIAKIVMLALGFNLKFSLAIFFSGYFVEAFPGIILQFILVPAIVVAFKGARLDFNGIKPLPKSCTSQILSENTDIEVMLLDEDR